MKKRIGLFIRLPLVGFFIVACGQAPTAQSDPASPTYAEPRSTAGGITPIPATPFRATPATGVGTTPEAGKSLGFTLGDVALRSPGTSFLQTHNESITSTITPGVGTREWIFQHGLIIDLWGMQDESAVRLITAVAPFDGATAEGFALGDTLDTFQMIYRDFSPSSVSATHIAIDDGHGVSLRVAFNSAGQAIQIILEDVKCPEEVAWCS